MKTYRSDAVIVGILFIIATSFLFIGEFFYKPILSAPDYLTTVAPNKPVVVFGILIEFICVLIIPMIAVFMFPVMKLYNESLALAYVVFRVLEAVILISVAEVNKLSLIGLSEDYLAQNGAEQAMYETIGRSILAENTWGDTAGLLYNLIFVLGALVLYVVLYRTRLIPRIISGWGFVSVLVLGVASIVAVFVDVSPTMTILLVAPLAVQEMAMALWFIIRGFDPNALATLSGRQISDAFGKVS